MDSIKDQPNFYESKNSTIVHCYAGFGRTGTALLFYALRDYFDDRRGRLRECLTNRFFNQGSSQGMFDWLKSKLSDFLYLDNTEGSQEIKQKISSFDLNIILHEVFDLGSSRDMIQLGYLSYIFITRINYIIWCLKVIIIYLVKNFPYYLYRCDHFKMLQERYGLNPNGYPLFASHSIFSMALSINANLDVPPVQGELVSPQHRSCQKVIWIQI